MLFSDNFTDAMYQYKAAREKFRKALKKQIEWLVDDLFKFNPQFKTLDIEEWKIYIDEEPIERFLHIQEARLISKLIVDWSDQFDLDMSFENKDLTVEE